MGYLKEALIITGTNNLHRTLVGWDNRQTGLY